MDKIVILDYGSSNLRSVAKALETATEGRHSVAISSRPEEILRAERIVFPGQGAIGQSMAHLKERMLDEVIRECLTDKPFLGICLGLQSLMDYSNENNGTECLGILPGNVLRFSDNVKDENGNVYKIPSIGWNRVYQSKPHPLWKDIKDGNRFYFLHSYYVKSALESDIAGSTDYMFRYTSAVARDNLFAVQFHPEKSQHDGLTLLKNFVHWKV